MAVLAMLEDLVAACALAAMVLLPLLEIAMRRLVGVGIPAEGPIVQHLVLWVGFLGAAIAARDRKLLALATGSLLPKGTARRVASIIASAIASAMTVLLASGAVQLVSNEREAATSIGANIPVWVTQLALPAGFALIAVRLAWYADDGWWGRVATATGLAVGGWLAQAPTALEGGSFLPWLAVLVIAAAFGAPIFAVLGGAAVLLFMMDGVTPAAVLIETYALNTSATLPAIPLFTLAGFLLAEGHASSRLLGVFRAWFGWIPGGTAVVCALLCSFFTVFTGGSGVTILALGGLLLPALLRDGYAERFSIGLLTASGSLGLLLPPALPLILYGIVAQLPIEDLFVGGILPGLLLTGMIAAWGVRQGLASGATRTTFNLREGVRALWAAKWELAMPIVVLVSLFSGWATAIESAALVAFYAFVVQTMIHRDITSARAVLRVLVECVTVVGGVLIILGVAVGLTNYLIGAQVPARLLEWTTSYIGSRLTFLLALNVFLLAVGCLMDIFSATVVVAPLLVPLGAAYDIHPVHLGIIFIANLELGYLTPPVGLNLFLASYRFKRSLLEVARASLPMLAILGVGVLVITYVPWLTLGLLRSLGRL
ncbi:MAG: TRAP transporter large permease subunit [Acidimicrobiia bacterium]|nr:TRAP transporter large permease subunit [Acidimicrobiia bacterium]